MKKTNILPALLLALLAIASIAVDAAESSPVAKASAPAGEASVVSLAVKVCEPFQMLGLVEDDLKEAMGVDTTSIFPNRTIFGFVNESWKLWRTACPT